MPFSLATVPLTSQSWDTAATNPPVVQTKNPVVFLGSVQLLRATRRQCNH